MIAKLRGLLDQMGEGWAVIDCTGVGYMVHCSTRTLNTLPTVGEAATLWVHTEMREDAIHLYGFAEPRERDWFRLLLKVQGVGARVALSILSVLSPDEVATAILAQDKGPITRADGVGPKLAGRIVSELKDRAGSLGGPAAAVPGHAAASGPAKGGPSDATADAVSALVNLGFRQAEAFTAVSAALRELGGTAAVEDLVRVGLRELSQ